MQSSSSDRTSLIRALASLRDDYGDGVPLQFVVDAERGSGEALLPKGPEALGFGDEVAVRLLIVVSDDEKKDVELVELARRIVEKGLEVPWEQARIVAPGDGDETSAPAALVFGTPDHVSFTQSMSPHNVLPTVSLSAIHRDANVKRQFWLRLQGFKKAVAHG